MAAEKVSREHAASRIVFFGPPGAGKGTQSVRLAAALGVPHISTGDMMRNAVASGSALGIEVKRYLDGGDLVPDDVIIRVIQFRLQESDCDRGFILDGFPRTLDQARALDAVMGELSRPISRVVLLEVPNDILLERIIKRSTSDGASRSDDTREVAAKRLGVYVESTLPLVEYYGAQGILRRIDGVGSVDEVEGRIRLAVR